MRINKETLDYFRKDLLEAVKGLEKKYGVEISTGTANYSDERFTLSIEARNLASTGINAETQNALDNFTWFREIYGKSFHEGRHTFTVIGYYFNKKYDIECKRDDGKTYCFTSSIYNTKEFF